MATCCVDCCGMSCKLCRVPCVLFLLLFCPCHVLFTCGNCSRFSCFSVGVCLVIFFLVSAVPILFFMDMGSAAKICNLVIFSMYRCSSFRAPCIWAPLQILLCGNGWMPCDFFLYRTCSFWFPCSWTPLQILLRESGCMPCDFFVQCCCSFRFPCTWRPQHILLCDWVPCCVLLLSVTCFAYDDIRSIGNLLWPFFEAFDLFNLPIQDCLCRPAFRLALWVYSVDFFISNVQFSRYARVFMHGALCDLA